MARPVRVRKTIVLTKKELLHRLMEEGLSDDPGLLDEINSLASSFPDAELPHLDREQVHEKNLTDLQKEWRENGVVILRNFIPDSFIDAYRRDWIYHNREKHDRPGGYPGNCPYYHVKSLEEMATYGELQRVLQELIGEPMGVHLCLTGWISTERNWHQDGYLNPDETREYSLAIWVALNDIHEDAGPFQYVPGTHVFPPISREKTLARLTEHDRHPDHWPKRSEKLLNPVFEDLRQKGRLKVKEFLGKKGDVLIWHTRLMHRGSSPKNPELRREAAIMHFSGTRHRADFPAPLEHKNGGWYFPIDERVPI